MKDGVVIIRGESDDIGRATVERLARDGASVVLVARVMMTQRFGSIVDRASTNGRRAMPAMAASCPTPCPL